VEKKVLILDIMNKRKLNSCLNEHWTHKGKNKMVPKVEYDTEYDAKMFIIENNLNPKYKAYKCSQCGKWHVGHMHFHKKK
jgi:hypothetical protein